MKLSTDRLIIRPFVENDKEALISIISDREVMRFSINGPITESEARKQLEHKDISFYEDKNFGMMALIRKNDHALIGFAGLLKQEIDGEQKVEISYRLHPKYWNQGFAIEAVTAIVQYAQTILKIDDLIAIIDKENLPSAKLATKLGMKILKSTTFKGKPVTVWTL